jgi:hypothetical protein
VLGLGVARGQRRGKAQRVARQPFEAVWIAYEHVRSRFGGDVQPGVARLAELEGQQVIVRRGAADENRQPIRRDETTRHRAALPDPLFGVRGRRWARAGGGHAR